MFKMNRKNYHHLIVEEKDIITIETLIKSCISNYNNQCELKHDNCGWKYEPTKCFISFNVTDNDYGKIIDAINKIGKVCLYASPNKEVVRSYVEI